MLRKRKTVYELASNNIKNMEYISCSSGSKNTNEDNNLCSNRTDDMPPPESTLTCSPYRSESMNSDSEDYLPSCVFKWSPTINKIQSGIEDERVKLNIHEILAKRKKDEEFFAQMDKLDELLKEKIELNDKPDNNFNPVMSEDADLKFILEKAKEMSVDETTLDDEPCHVIMKSESSLTIFNHETLQLKHFVDSVSEKIEEDCATFDTMYYKFSQCEFVNWPENDEEGFCSFIFYVMSVHPNDSLADHCFSFLRNKHDYYHPCLTDFINVFRNWGCDLRDLYVTVPNIYTDFQNSIKVIKPIQNAEVKRHNIEFVFRYLEIILKVQSPNTFCELIEPLIRLYFDVKVYGTLARAAIRTSILFLTGSYSYSLHTPKRVLVKNIHLNECSLLHQTKICTQIFFSTPFELPLGYAILQQFLGCSKIIYCQHVDLKEVYTLLAEKKNIIETSTSLDICCYLEIIKIFLFSNELIDGKVHTRQINHNNWHDLVHDWSLRISRNGHSADAIVLEENIAKLQYQLRMKQAVQTRHQLT